MIHDILIVILLLFGCAAVLPFVTNKVAKVKPSFWVATVVTVLSFAASELIRMSLVYTIESTTEILKSNKEDVSPILWYFFIMSSGNLAVYGYGIGAFIKDKSAGAIGFKKGILISLIVCTVVIVFWFLVVIALQFFGVDREILVRTG